MRKDGWSYPDYRWRNNRSSNSSSSGGVGVPGLLQVAFIVLKLCGVINWSWLWVLAPTWIMVGIVILIAAIIFIKILLHR